MLKSNRKAVQNIRGSLLQRILLFSGVNIIAILCIVYFFGAQYTASYNETIQHNIEASLDDTYSSLDETYDDFRQIGQLLTASDSTGYTGGAGRLLTEWPEYLFSENMEWNSSTIMEFVQMWMELRDSMENMRQMNATLGEYVVFSSRESGGHHSVMTNSGVTAAEDVEQFIDWPILMKMGNYTFHLPHTSLFSQDEVVSVICKLNYRHEIYLYMETKADWFEAASRVTVGERCLPLVISDDQGTVLYSQNEELVRIGSQISDVQKEIHLFTADKYSQDKWQLHVAMENADYQQVFDGWNQGFLWLCFGSFFLLVVVNCLLYWTLYGSIKRLCRYIDDASQNESLPNVQYTGMREFDSILDSFYEYHNRNTKLLHKVNEKEELAQQLRYEKLLLQINPHFIHNSLNSIQWMARINHQPQIENMVNSLVKVFNYNLNEDMMSNLREEMVAIRAYMELQSLRYGDKLNVEYHIEENDYELPIPRFLLQPMLENAILYGMDEEGGCHIVVRVQRDTEKTYLLSIQDGGSGFSDSLREKILMGEISKGNGLGIGLRYVLSMLQYYNGAIRDIETDKNGTVISLVLPSEREGEAL